MRLALIILPLSAPPSQLWAAAAPERGLGWHSRVLLPSGAVLVGSIELTATSLERVVEGAKRLGRLLGSLVLGASLLVRRRDWRLLRTGFAEGFREAGGFEAHEV